MEIPPDFDTPWGMSDVVIRTENSDGKPLHAVRAILDTYSPFFERMPITGEINLDVEYDGFLRILKSIHHIKIDWNCLSEQKFHSWITSMYKVAAELEFPLIQQMCVDRILGVVSNPGPFNNLCIAYDLNLHDVFMEILRGPHCDYEFDSILDKDAKVFFCRSDLPVFYKRKNGVDFTRDPDFPRIVSPVNLEDFATEPKNPRHWRHFRPTHKILFEECKEGGWRIPAVKTSDGEATVLHVDAEYTTLKEILSIIHHCDMDFTYGDYKKRHEILLYDMYMTAGEDQLDIPMIRKLVVDHFNHYTDIPHCRAYSYVFLEVALKLQAPKERIHDIIVNLPYDELREWVFIGERDVVYMKNGQEVNVTSCQTQAILTLETCEIFMKRVEWQDDDSVVEYSTDGGC